MTDDWDFWYNYNLGTDPDGVNYSYYSMNNFDSPYLTDDYIATQAIKKYLFPFLLFLGSLGSFPCLILLNRYSHTVWSASIYVSLIFIIDLIKLYVHCGDDWYQVITNESLSWNILILSNSICKVYSFLSSFIDHMSSWIVVALATELLIAINFPRHMYQMCTRERAQAVIMLIVVILVCLNLHYFWTVGLSMPESTPDIDQPLCHHNYELSEEFQSVILPLINFFITNVFPLLIVSVCLLTSLINLVHVYMFLRNRSKLEELESLLEKYFLDLKTLHSLKLATFIMLIWFLLNRTVAIIFDVMVRFADEDSYSFVIFQTVLSLMDYAYLSLTPYIFIFTCQKIREDIMYAFRCYVYGKERRQNKLNKKKTQDKQPKTSTSSERTSVSSERNVAQPQPRVEILSHTNSGARPKIYKATGIGTSTGV